MNRQIKHVGALCTSLHKHAATFGNKSTNSLVFSRLAEQCDADLKRLADRRRNRRNG